MERSKQNPIAPDDPRVVEIARALVALLAVAGASTAPAAPDELVAVSETGEARRALLREIRAGRLAAVKLGRRLWIRRSDLAALAVRREPEAPAETTPEAAYLRLIGARRTA